KEKKQIFYTRKSLKRKKHVLVFSQGGSVSFPVLLTSKSLKIPVYIHESDLTPGLANKISTKFATKCYVTFKKTMDYLPEDKAEYLGPVIRDELLNGYSEKGYELSGFEIGRAHV